MTHTPDIRAAEPPKPLSMLNTLTIQRERVYARLQGLPARSDRAIALRAHMAALTNEILAYEPGYAGRSS